ncbi:hypothetical protein ABZS29_32245 [Kribbella sp. NPDC005582]|uniref:hypothetical protein n=1 Tax=Kribbella sp. NPDC005582 TaxID=3156893 RepID=UPI0033B75FC1
MPNYQQVPPESAVHREFTRLYRLAQQQRPGAGDAWNGELYAVDGGAWAQLNRESGAIALSSQHVLPHLSGQTRPEHAHEQATALRQVLKVATRAGMPSTAAASPQASGLAVGVVEVRAATDFDAFAERAGYPNLPAPPPEAEGAFAATDSLLTQSSGLTTSRDALLSELVATPVGMQFDRLANGVVRNRLREEIPYDAARQEAARARLIVPMMHEAWPALPQHAAADGRQVGEEIRTGLNSAVEDLRHEHRHPGAATPAADGAGRGQEHSRELRFLTGQASAGGATARRPSLGDGARGAGAPAVARAGRQAGREDGVRRG